MDGGKGGGGPASGGRKGEGGDLPVRQGGGAEARPRPSSPRDMKGRPRDTRGRRPIHGEHVATREGEGGLRWLDGVDRGSKVCCPKGARGRQGRGERPPSPFRVRQGRGRPPPLEDASRTRAIWPRGATRRAPGRRGEGRRSAPRDRRADMSRMRSSYVDLEPVSAEQGGGMEATFFLAGRLDKRQDRRRRPQQIVFRSSFRRAEFPCSHSPPSLPSSAPQAIRAIVPNPFPALAPSADRPARQPLARVVPPCFVARPGAGAAPPETASASLEDAGAELNPRIEARFPGGGRDGLLRKRSSM